MPLFHVKDRLAGLKEDGKAFMFDLRAVAQHGSEHIAALFSLFGEESRAYVSVQGLRLVLLLGGLFLIVVFYLFLCAAALLLLGPCLGWAAAAAIVAAFNLLLALPLLLKARAMQPSAFAPQTKQELQADLQCLKLMMKESSK